MPKGIGIVCLCLGMFLTAFTSADAQYRPPFQVVPRINRALGHWNGFGYHTCNPGPDTSYYNPWTQKNSYLISQSPEFLARFGHELNPTPMDLLRSGQTAFGQPAFGQSPYGSDYYGAPGALNADFVPNNRDEDEDEDEDFDSRDADEDEDAIDDGEDFTPRDEYEDRFDEDADGIEGGSDPFDEQAEAFEKADEPGALQGGGSAGSSSKGSATKGSTSSSFAVPNSSTLRDPGGIFLPASHPSLGN